MVQAEFEPVMKKAMEGQLAAYGRQYVLQDAIVTGKSFKSFVISDVEKDGDRMSISLAPQGDRAKVINWIENGRLPNRSGNPSEEMVKNVREWMLQKGIVSGAADEREVRVTAWAIAATIAHEGFEGKHIIETASKIYRPRIKQMFEAAARRLAAKINQRLTNE